MLNVNYNQKMINVSTKNSGPQLGLEKEKLVCECIRCPIHTDAYYFWKGNQTISVYASALYFF